ncbi:MAG: CinA family protein [Actinocatenispora sp.]
MTDAAAAGVVATLTRRGETLATAESLTGGQLAATVVDVPGASAVLRGGLVVYASDLKVSLAGVPPDLLERVGPVDPDVAVALARGARDRCGANWALSTTGVAGPEPHGGQPAGTVFVGLAGPDLVRVERLDLSGDRSAVRSGTVDTALRLLASVLAGR